jgi:hypothetical protein
MSKSIVRAGVFSMALLAVAFGVRAGDVEPPATRKTGSIKVSVVDTDKNPQAGILIQLMQIEHKKQGGGSLGGRGGKSSFGNGGAINMAPAVDEEETKDDDEVIRQAKKTGADGKVLFEKCIIGSYRVAQIRNGKIHQSARALVEEGKTYTVELEMMLDKPKAK